jgi:HPt (histidine-containing phosphotransfer) domain-containing protein
VRIDLFARVADVMRLDREESLEGIAAQHVYGERLLRERFHYRRPGLWLLAVQIFRAPSTMEMTSWPKLAGCHSWVELPRALSTDGLSAVLEPSAFASQVAQLRECLDLPAASPTATVASGSIAVMAPPAEATASGAGSALDMAAVLDRFGADEGLVERLISIYQQDRFPLMSRALGALVAQDTQALVFAAHRLHGLLVHFDASPAAESAGRLEQFARQADFDAAQTAFGQLEADLAALDTALAAWRNGG